MKIKDEMKIKAIYSRLGILLIYFYQKINELTIQNKNTIHQLELFPLSN